MMTPGGFDEIEFILDAARAKTHEDSGIVMAGLRVARARIARSIDDSMPIVGASHVSQDIRNLFYGFAQEDRIVLARLNAEIARRLPQQAGG